MAEKPNIVLILADDLGFADIGCYGSEIETPNLNRLAERGLRFSQLYNSARCCPSRAALLTGLHPHQAGIGWMTYPIPDADAAHQGYLNDHCVTIAEVLKSAGYHTIMSGKWHIGNWYEAQHRETWTPGAPGWPIPTQRGFDHFYGTLDGAGSFFNPHMLMHQETLIRPESPDFYYTDAIADNAIQQIGNSLDNESPFFAYVAFTAPHWPLHALKEDIAKYETTYRCGWDAIRTSRHEEQKANGLINPNWEISPRDPDSWPFEASRHGEWEAMRMAVYAAQVDRMDQGIGRIVKLLQGRGALDDTLIFFLSDNGGCAEFLKEDTNEPEPDRYNMPTLDGRPMRVGNLPHLVPGGADTFMSYDLPWANASNTPFRRYKSWVHEGGISTPFIMHWPAKIKTPGMVHTPFHIIDIMPTCVEVSGAKYPSEYNDQPIQPMEGESLMTVMTNPAWRRKQPIWFEHEGNRALRDGAWKLVKRHPQRWELYHIDEDRTELNDLAASDGPRLATMVDHWNNEAARVGVGNLRELHDRVAEYHKCNCKTVQERFRLS